jgi:biopolymer transport protein ExbD
VIDRTPVVFTDINAFAEDLRRAGATLKNPVVVISADAKATHQSVIRVMEAARVAGLSRITFTTQSGPGG